MFCTILKKSIDINEIKLYYILKYKIKFLYFPPHNAYYVVTFLKGLFVKLNGNRNVLPQGDGLFVA